MQKKLPNGSGVPRGSNGAERLRARLAEAEQTLEAIRSGSVDALVVTSPTGEKVFTLQGAVHRFLRIVEQMTEGAIIVSPVGAILYANSSFAALVAAPLDRVLGSPLRRYVPGVATSTFDRLLRDAKDGTVSADTQLRAWGRRGFHVHVSAAPSSD